MQYCRRWRWQPLALGDPIFSIMTALVITMTLSAHATQTPPLDGNGFLNFQFEMEPYFARWCPGEPFCSLTHPP